MVQRDEEALTWVRKSGGESGSQVRGDKEEEPAALDSSDAKNLPFCGTSCLCCSSGPCSALPVVALLVLPVVSVPAL